MYIDELKASSLAKFLNDHEYVIIDTSSLMEDGFCLFMDSLEAAQDYLANDLHIQIYQACLDELDKHSSGNDRKEDEKRVNAIRAKKILKREKSKFKKILEFPKKTSETKFADNVIFVAASQLRIRYRVLVITQDKTLADDLHKLNDLGSQLGRYLETYRINEDGSLSELRNPKKAVALKDGRTVYPGSSFVPSLSSELTRGKTVRANGNEHKLGNFKPIDKEAAKPSFGDGRAKKETVSEKTAQRLSKDRPIETKAKETPILSKPTAKIVVRDQAPKPLKVIEEPKPQTSTSKGYIGEGNTIQYALKDAERRNGFMFRDKTIPYMAMVHGPLDLVIEDKEGIVSALEGKTPNEVDYKSLHITSSKTPKGIKLTLEAIEKPAVPAKAEAPKTTRGRKPKAKTEEKPKEEQPQKEIAPKATKARKSETKAEPAKKEAKPAAKKTTTKASSKPKAEPKPEKEEKPETLVKANLPKKAQPKVKQPKPIKVEDVVKSEARLRSVYSNDNYPKDQKIADIKTQISLVEKLSEEDLASIKLSKADLEEMLSKLN